MNKCKMSIDSDSCNHCKGRYCAQKVSIFEKLDEMELKELTSKIKNKKYSKSEIIFFEGDNPSKLFLINSGRVKVYKYNKEGKEQIFYILSEGDFVGDASIFTDESMKYNAEAIEDTSICELSKEDFKDIIQQNPNIALKVLKTAYERIDRLQELITSLTTKDIESRIAGLLLGFIKDFGSPREDGIEMEIPFSREDLANYIGVTRETISRKLSIMQEEGILEMRGNKNIKILNLKLLEEKHHI